MRKNASPRSYFSIIVVPVVKSVAKYVQGDAEVIFFPAQHALISEKLYTQQKAKMITSKPLDDAGIKCFEL